MVGKSFVLTHRHKRGLLLTYRVNSIFLDILELRSIDLSELSQEDLESFLGILAVLHPEIALKSSPLSHYVLRYV